jgi:mannose-6-phosphate isomerase-like protein (cupin superfamily)|tara:strand:+ start:507 stop:914 length:408 start_codon:yes stop_codon:yes gene_type:complete
MIKTPKHVKSAWVSNSSTYDKPWGSETSWSAMPAIDGKLLRIKKGCRNSLKYHSRKDECLFVLSGEVEVQYGTERTLVDPVGYPFETRQLSEGQALNVQSSCPYRIKAITDAVIIEIGSQGPPDFVRIEDDYGRK